VFSCCRRNDSRRAHLIQHADFGVQFRIVGGGVSRESPDRGVRRLRVAADESNLTKGVHRSSVADLNRAVGAAELVLLRGGEGGPDRGIVLQRNRCTLVSRLLPDACIGGTHPLRGRAVGVGQSGRSMPTSPGIQTFFVVMLRAARSMLA
jgi:hypothetical protein